MNIANTFNAQNKGLPINFNIQEGKFLLLGGEEKVNDNMKMFMLFIGHFRIFNQRFVINAEKFIQNTTNYLLRFKNILRLQILNVGSTQLDFATIKAVDISIDYTQGRKSSVMYIEFDYNLRGSRIRPTTIRTILDT